MKMEDIVPCEETIDIEETHWVKVGDICVDSGQIIIIDPCYLRGWKAGNFNAKKYDENPKEYIPENSYAETCKVTLSEKGYGQILNSLGFATGTLYGDGTYGVYALFEGKRIATLLIDFEGHDLEEE